MNLKIYKVSNRYFFSVDGFNSYIHYFLCPDVKSSYPNFRSAYSAGVKMTKKGYHIQAINRFSAEDETRPFVADLSAEQMLNQHYSELLILMEERARSEFKLSEEREWVYQEIKQAVDELEKILEHIDKKGKTQELIGKFKKIISTQFPDLYSKDLKNKKEQEDEEIAPVGDIGQPPGPPAAIPSPVMASSVCDIKPLKKCTSSETIDCYGENSCRAIEQNHPDAFFKINSNNIFICEPTKGREINVLLKVAVNKDLKINGIFPQQELAILYPIYSTKFYQRYWKPIVEANGHYFIDDASILIVPERCCLPDMPNKAPTTFSLTGWHVHKKQELPIKLSFRGDDMIWFFENEDKVIKSANTSRYTEEDFIRNAPVRVQCIDQQLNSIYNKFGEVVQVVPLETGLELDINFGRHIVRLTEEQIKVVQ